MQPTLFLHSPAVGGRALFRWTRIFWHQKAENSLTFVRVGISVLQQHCVLKSEAIAWLSGLADDKSIFKVHTYRY